ncbi:hypothetical protein L6R52_19535 [Myxococcota bacterium]|nr:hypothetical protein [Myxococcota bacterium]
MPDVGSPSVRSSHLILGLCLGAVGAFVPRDASAAPDDAGAGAPIIEKMKPWSTDLLDPAGLTRFHLVTRVTFGDGRSVFSGSSTWSQEARLHLRLSDGVALLAAIPVGIVSRSGELGAHAQLGNAAVGVAFGVGSTSLDGAELRFGAGFDGYFPTASLPDDRVALPYAAVAAIRAYEPQLFIPKMLSLRARGLAEVSTDTFSAALELGLVPTFSLRSSTAFALLLSVGGRVSAVVASGVEPFFEVACTPQVAGEGEITPPLLFTPGVRFHIAEAFDPAFFISFNAVAPSAVIFGVDLARAVRVTRGRGSERHDRTDDFLGDF